MFRNDIEAGLGLRLVAIRAGANRHLPFLSRCRPQPAEKGDVGEKVQIN